MTLTITNAIIKTSMELTTSKFEDFLKDKHAENYMGTDDDMPDSFDNWLGEQDSITIHAYASLYAHEQGKLLAAAYLKQEGFDLD